MPRASQRVMPCAMPAKPRKSPAKLPITNNENVKTAESSGDENEENSSDREQMTRNSRMMKYKATNTEASDPTNLCETYSRAAKTPMAMKNVFTTRVPARPKYLPTINSQRRTGRESTVYRVRFSISFETRPMPMKIAMTMPNNETAVSPRLITTSRSISIEICPTRIDAPDNNKAKAIKL